MDAQSEKLLKFLRNVFYTDRGKPITRFQLVREVGEIDRPLFDWPIKEVRAYDEPKIIELSNEVLDWAQADCNGNPQRTSSYALLAFLGENKSTDLRSLTIRMRPSVRGDEASEFETAKNEKEAFGQLCGLVKTLSDVVVRGEAQRQQHSEHMIARLMNRCEELESGRLDTIKLLEELATEKLDRDLKQRKAEALMAFQKEAFAKLKLLGPTLINRALGKAIIPELTNPGTEAMKALIEDLEPEQVTAIQELLKPHQWATLEALMRALVRHDSEKGGTNGQSVSAE